MLDITVFDATGVLGAFLIVCAYLLLQIGRIRSDSVAFSTFNAVGAAGIIVSLVFDFNLSAMIIEVFWLAISLYGIYRALWLRRSAANQLKETDNLSP